MLPAHGLITSTSNYELAARVAQLERRLNMMQQSAESPIEFTQGRNRRESGTLGPAHENDSHSPASTQLQRVLEPDGQSFMGELSMTSALAEVDGSLSEESADNIIKVAGDLPRDRHPRNNKSSRKVRGWLENILERYGVVADEDEWRRYMELFFEEIHVLYPVLHPPSVWETFNGLWEVAGRTDTTKALEGEIEIQLSEKHATAIPYLVAMIRYSRLVGKAWELIYGVKASSNQPVSHMIDYADTVLSNLLETLPEELTYDPDLPKAQFDSRKRWQVKQTMLLSTCVTFLRILIRRPFAQGKGATDLTSDNQLESLTICASLASNILNAHKDLNDSSMKYCFPYCHYLLSCTMVMTSLVANEPALKKRHREAILAATRSLRLYCHTIWVSGKMMRWVSRLTLLARRVLQVGSGQRSGRSRRMSDAPHDRDDDAAEEEMQPQQLTPLSGTHEFSQDSMPSSGPNNSSGASYGMPSHIGASSKPQGGREDQGMPHMWLLDGTSTEAGLPELPEWVMTDFNFETISGDVFGPGNASFKNAAGNSDEIQDNGMGLEMSMGETMLDAMPNGIYSLDMNLD
ncbi:hypothetical protein SLS64_007459 [Diaporthe eres]